MIVPTFTCEKCLKKNFPYGNQGMDVPRYEVHPCEYCGFISSYTWQE